MTYDMATALDADFGVVANMSTVTFSGTRTSGGAFSLTNVEANDSPHTKDEQQYVAASQFNVETKTWRLQASAISGKVPQEGDLITDSDSTVWIAKFIKQSGLGTRYRVTCTKGATNG